MTLENDSKVLDVWVTGWCGVVDGEAEVLGGFGEGFGADQ